MAETDLPVATEEPTPEEQISGGWTLRKLGDRHKIAASLLAQGNRRAEIAAITNYTPEYISFLTRQPLFREYVREMGRFSEERLAALFDEAVDVIADTMRNGTEEGRLKAVRLQMEATGRIGRERARPAGDGEGDALGQLADRLVALMRDKRREHGQEPIAGTYTIVEDAQELRSPGGPDSAELVQDASLDKPSANEATNALPAANTGRRLTDKFAQPRSTET